jgi:glycosyltransferase involved in cell wall biosynthesis
MPYEGFGLPPLEAMRCGCPVIVASTASLPEVCGDAALYVDPSSTDEIAAAMRRVIDDDALCADLRVRGIGRARELTWAAAAARLLEALPAPGSRG